MGERVGRDSIPNFARQLSIHGRGDEAIEVCPGAMEAALRCYTLSGVYTSFEEKIKGSIEVGKLADLAVLSEDPTWVDPGKIKDIPVMATMVSGEFSYEKA